MKGPLILRAGKGSRLFDQLGLRPDACVKHKLFDRLERDHFGTANRLLSQFCSANRNERCFWWKGDDIEDQVCCANQVFGKGELISLESARHPDRSYIDQQAGGFHFRVPSSIQSHIAQRGRLRQLRCAPR